MPQTLLGQYLEAVGQLRSRWAAEGEKTVNLWFRGHADRDWTLEPSLYRSAIRKDFEREMVRDFALQARNYVDSRPMNSLEWLFVMQHYGGPTRLLDWTEGFLPALFFAVADKTLHDRDGCVWVLDPWTLNSMTLNAQTVPSADDDLLRDFHIDFDADSTRCVLAADPAAVRPTRITPRIMAQRGVFTIHGSRRTGLETLEGIFVTKMTVPAAHKPKLKKEIYCAGVSPLSLFPDISGVCRDVFYRYSDEFMEYITPESQGVPTAPRDKTVRPGVTSSRFTWSRSQLFTEVEQSEQPPPDAGGMEPNRPDPS